MTYFWVSFWSKCTFSKRGKRGMAFWIPSISQKDPIKKGLSIVPSVLLSFCLSGHFIGIVLELIFSKSWHGARISCEVVHDRAGFFWKMIFAPKNGKMVQKRPKTRFFNLLENLVISFYWIWSIMKIHIIFCVPAQIPYLGKCLFLRYGPKCCQPIRL